MKYTFHIVGEDRRHRPSPPSPADLAAVLSIEPAQVRQVFFAASMFHSVFAPLGSNDEVVDHSDNQASRR
jgi:hypothetical protein